MIILQVVQRYATIGLRTNQLVDLGKLEASQLTLVTFVKTTCA